MSGSLTQSEVDKLKAAGLSAAEIRTYTSGSPRTALIQKVDRVLRTGTTTPRPTPRGGAAGGLSPRSNASLTPRMKSDAPRTRGGAGGIIIPRKGAPPPRTPLVYSDAERQANDVALDRRKPMAPKGDNVFSNAADIIFGRRKKPTAGSTGVDSTTIDTSGAPAIPDIPGITPQVISPKDFSAEARQMAAEAFAPLLASLDSSKVNIGAQGERTRKILSGLYENMVNDIATTAAQTSKQYEGQQAEAGSRDAALQASIGGGYDKGQQQVSSVAQQLGLGTAVPSAVGEMEADQQWLQGLAGKDAGDFQQYLQTQQQGAADQAASWQDTARTSGTVAQEGNLNQVAQMLAGVDQQIAGATTDQLQTALDLGQQLTDRDLNAQQFNSGQDMTAQQAAQQAILSRYGLEQDAWRTGIEDQQWQAGYNRDISNDAWTRSLQQSQLDLDVGTAAAKGGQAGESVAPQTPIGKAQFDIEQAFPVDGLEAFNSIQQTWSSLDADGLPVNEKNEQNWISAAVQAAQQAGISPAAARYAALQFWRTAKGTS